MTWADKWRVELKDRGYEMVTADHDPVYGWCVVYMNGDRQDHFEAKTTVQVSKRIARLKRRAAA